MEDSRAVVVASMVAVRLTVAAVSTVAAASMAAVSLTVDTGKPT